MAKKPDKNNPTNKIKKQEGSRKPGTWQPGQSGNPRGKRPDEASLTSLMRNYLNRTSDKNKNLKNKDIFIRKVFKRALVNNDIACIKLIWNYLDGMPKQSTEVTGDGRIIVEVLKEFTHDTD